MPMTELTCTAQLQTFHRPRKVRQGSPVKAENLGLEAPTLFFDPRPAKYRKLPSYPDFVKNLALNHSIQTGKHIPLLQTIPPADINGIDKDHDYMDRNPVQKFIESLCVEHITPEEVDKLEAITASDKQAWKQERRKRIQSSKLGRVMTAVSSEAKYNLAKEMIDGRDFVSKFTAHGHAFESVAIKRYEEIMGTTVKQCGLFVSMDYPYLAATPDGLVGEDTVIEVKCPYSARYRVVTPESVPYLVHDQSGDLCLNSKHEYYAQVQGQMLATDRRMCHFVVHTLVPDTKIINVPYDNAFVDQMLDKVKDFYDNFFKPFLLKKLHYKQWEVWESIHFVDVNIVCVDDLAQRKPGYLTWGTPGHQHTQCRPHTR